MAIYVLINNSSRLIHVPTSKNVNDTKALIPGAVEKVEIGKDDTAFFKATVTGVPGLDVFTEAKYADYIKNKAAAEAVLTGGLDDEDAADESAATEAVAQTAPAGGWVS